MKELVNPPLSSEPVKTPPVKGKTVRVPHGRIPTGSGVPIVTLALNSRLSVGIAAAARLEPAKILKARSFIVKL